MNAADPKAKTTAKRLPDGTWSLKVACPYCGKTHHHGGGNGAVPGGGHRSAHCHPARGRDYFLEITQ